MPDHLLDAVVAAANVSHLPANTYLWSMAEQTASVYGVVSGCVRTAIPSAQGHEFAINDCEVGTWLGAPCLVNDGGRVIEAKTLVASELLVISRKSMLGFAEEWPLLYRNLLRHNVEESRGLYVLLTGMAFYPLRARVAGRLLELIKERGVAIDGGTRLSSKLSQNDFAQLAVGSRQRVNKIFREWDKSGLIENCDDYLLIRDVAALEREIMPFE
ncbi:MAG: Crp/Fnr family transcriptional regulator [Haliea sp.]|jgi:CRP/FNR family transcriptional regulator, cyclic AMP receptor protein|nr:Crp/Fnr family transcriptional regulator [Haliea sp.]